MCLKRQREIDCVGVRGGEGKRTLPRLGVRETEEKIACVFRESKRVG